MSSENRDSTTVHNEERRTKSKGKGHVRLRAVEPEDLDLMYLIENDTTLWAMGSSNVPYSRFALRQFIAETQNDIFRDGQLRLVIERTEDGEAVGFVDLQNFDVRNSRAEVGIVLMPEAQRSGLASEALSCLLHYVQEHVHLHLLYALVAVDNEAALRLFRRAGFSATATLPKWLRKGNGYTDVQVFTRELL